MSNAPPSPVSVTWEDPVAVLRIERADARNALSRALVQALGETCARLASDPSVRAIVLTGAGDAAFCAGADLKERASMTSDDVRAFLDALSVVLGALEASTAPVIAAINGVALGGGLELALACDIRIASERAVVGLPEVRLGIIPGAGGTQRLPRAVGAARALELILTGRRLSAHEALDAGIVSRVVPHGELIEAALGVGREIALGAPLAIAAAKRALREGQDLPHARGLATERAHYEGLLDTRDRIEALRAFAEKRAPAFQGR